MKILNRKNAAISSPRPIKIVQFGEGNFLRGFTAWMVELLNEQSNFNGDIQVVQPLTNGLANVLNQQDGLYHLILQGLVQGKKKREIKRITCIRGAINPYTHYTQFLELAQNPDLKFIFSNTTEAGIVFEPKDSSPAQCPDGFPGKLCALLYERFKHFNTAADAGLVIIPCELIDKNAEQLKYCILQYAAHWNLGNSFTEWVVQHCTFCNSLVDRIVPGYPKDTIEEIKAEIGFDDKLPVVAEPFHLWVIEAPDWVQEEFPAYKIGLDVKFVKDLSPYRTRKVRILNGAHTALVPVAYLAGYRTVREAVEDEKIGGFIREVIQNEIIPTLDLPPQELQAFAHDVIDRFRNPFIRHELQSIALNGISKFKVRVLPSILAYQQRKGSWPKGLIKSFAALLLFYKGHFNGSPIPLNDDPEILSFFRDQWQFDGNTLVEKVLANSHFWGDDLSLYPGLKEAITAEISLFQSLNAALNT
jgi:tagaturonate reductase